MQSVSILFFHFSPVQVKTSFFTITIYTVYINGLCKFTLHAHFSPFQLVFSIPRSNPFPTFNCCMQNDIISVLFCLRSFYKKKQMYVTDGIFLVNRTSSMPISLLRYLLDKARYFGLKFSLYINHVDLINHCLLTN